MQKSVVAWEDRVQTTDSKIAQKLNRLKDVKLIAQGSNCNLWLFKVPKGFKLKALNLPTQK